MFKQKNSKILIIISFFVGLFILNQFVWYTSDDFSYHYFLSDRYVTENTRELTGIIDFFKSQISHYNLWNGRYIPHFFLQIFMQMNKFIFNIFNSAAFILVGILINKINTKASKNTTNSVFYLLFTFIIMWFFIPEFDLTYLWMAGAMNYTWLSLIYLSFIYYIIKNDGNYNNSILCILAFLTGATNENTGPASIIVVVLLLILFHLKNNSRVILKQIFFSIFFGILGFISIILSPAAQERGKLLITPKTLFGNLNEIFNNSFPLFAPIYLLIIILVILLVIMKHLNKSDFKYIFIFISGHILSIYSLILSKEAPTRTFFGGAIYLFILSGFLVMKFLQNIKYTTIIKSIISILLLISFANSYTGLFVELRKIHFTDLERFRIIENANKEGIKNVSLPIYKDIDNMKNPMRATANIKKHTDSWINEWYAKWFDLDSVEGY